MYDNTELRILERVYVQPGIHKRELSKQLNLSMPSIDFAIKKIEKILSAQRSGNQIRYFPDYSKEALTPMLYNVEYSRFEKLPSKVRFSIREFLNELKEKPAMVILFGSYAKNNHGKESDIDIFLVFQEIKNIKDVENTAKRISMRTDTMINPVYLDYKSFRESFHNASKDFFNKLKKDKIILVGIEWWRQLKDEET